MPERFKDTASVECAQQLYVAEEDLHIVDTLRSNVGLFGVGHV